MKKNFSLYGKYFQKSRVFLYPALKISRGSSVTPIQTYVTMEGRYTLDDCCLIAVYPIRFDDEYKIFVKNKLKGNKYYKESFEIKDEEKIVFVFDFNHLENDWKLFSNGKFSKLSVPLKNDILSFYKNNSNNFAYVESYLYPYKYYRLYADALTTSSDESDKMYFTLKQVGELCSKPDLEQENLIYEFSKLVQNL